MTDGELLEAAAKGAGYKWRWFGANFCIENNPELGTYRPWAPLTDDGDAFRLAVNLNLDVDICFSQVGVCYVFNNSAGEADADNVMEQVGTDPLAATRRAIVRAAAAING